MFEKLSFECPKKIFGSSNEVGQFVPHLPPFFFLLFLAPPQWHCPADHRGNKNNSEDGPLAAFVPQTTLACF
jgi:hypothetical protein